MKLLYIAETSLALVFLKHDLQKDEVVTSY